MNDDIDWEAMFWDQVMELELVKREVKEIVKLLDEVNDDVTVIEERMEESIWKRIAKKVFG